MEHLIEQIGWLQDKVFLRGFVFGFTHVGIMLIGWYTGLSIYKFIKIFSILMTKKRLFIIMDNNEEYYKILHVLKCKKKISSSDVY